jgi:hypothetical protein
MFSQLARDRKIVWAAAVGLAAIVAITLVQIFKPGGSGTATAITDMGSLVFALVNLVLAVILWRASSPGEVLRLIWGSLAVGFLLWAAGEAMWTYYRVIAGQELPYPSLADIAWTIGYIPLVVGLFVRYRSFQTTPTRSRLLVIGGLFAAILILAIVFLIVPIVTYTGYERQAEQFLDVLYPVGDLAVAFAAMLVVLVLSGGELSLPWLFISAGFVVIALSDLLFSYATWNELYVDGSFLQVFTDITYPASYVIIALGFYIQARFQRVL